MLVSVNKNIIPFFSVIITSYNRANKLSRAVNSLINQTCTDWECILVDDGSSDNTFELAKTFCDSNDKFRYVYHSNRKQSLSKNAGILASSGIFVTFLDSDDEYDTEHLAIRQKILFQNPEVELLHGGVKIIGNEFVPDKDNPNELIHIYDCIIGGTFFINKYSAVNLGGFPLTDYGDDTDFFDLAVKSELVIAKIDHPSYIYYRDSEDSLCNQRK